MSYVTTCKVGLPGVLENGEFAVEPRVVAAGEKLTVTELKKHGQTDNDIAALVKGGALEEE
jgi:hypothetical protein